jgi:DNA-binding NarL/FixJ family response regulator
MGKIEALGDAAPGDDTVTVRVFLVDDHELVRAGIRTFIDSEDDLEVVGEASTAEEALATLAGANPDLAIIDLRLPDGDGVELCREIRSRHATIRTLILTSFADETAVVDSILAGASGFLLKTTKRDQLLADIRTVARGESLIDPNVTATLFGRLRQQAAASQTLAALTDQERRVLDLIGEGLTNAEISGRLFLAEQTVKNYVSNILGKLGLKHRTQAALLVSKLDHPD